MGIFDFFKLFDLGNSPKYVSVDTERKIKADWDRIKELVSSKSPSALKQALLIADKDIDAALRDILGGDSLGERLKNAKNLFDRDTYHKLWEAHKIRNNLVHEPDFDPPYYAITEAIESYRQALSQLRVNL